MLCWCLPCSCWAQAERADAICAQYLPRCAQKGFGEENEADREEGTTRDKGGAEDPVVAKEMKWRLRIHAALVEALAVYLTHHAVAFRADRRHPTAAHHHNARAHHNTELHAVRRPLRPAITERKRAERKARIESRQADALDDPTLLTDKSFAKCELIHPSSKRALVEDLGLQSMTEVQAKTIHAALARKDILARAKTGTGKTFAFLIPAVERIKMNPTYVPGRSICCLILAPTRELAIQIGEEASSLTAHHSDVSVQVMFGGTKMARDMNAFNRRLPSILVATPGRLLDHLRETSLRGRKFGDDIMAQADIVVLDEIDRLLDMGFRREIERILSYLPRKAKRQTMLFSATIPRGLKRIMQESLNDDYVEVDCVNDGGSISSPTNIRVSQSYAILPCMSSFLQSTYAVLGQATSEKPFKVIVFLPTARLVGFLAEFLNDAFGCPVMDLHSKKTQSARRTASENFRQATSAILLTSDVSARGIDFPDVTQVIQIGLPESRENYIHRLGRTARAGKEGKGLLVMFPFESKARSELKGLDISRNEGVEKLLEESASSTPEWLDQNLLRLSGGDNKLARGAQLAYLSFLGYYLGQENRIRSSKDEIVAFSSEFARSIGLVEAPEIPSTLVSKMGLEGVKGVKIKDD